MCSLPDEMYREILESLPTGLCVVDLQKKILLWSDGAERITGRYRHEVVGHSCVGEALLHCDHQDCEWCNEECPLARAMKTSQFAETTGFFYHKDGYEIPVHARSVPIRNAHGSIIGAVEIFEEQVTVASPENRKEALNIPGCVDELTGVATRVMMLSHLRETLGAFTELQIPFGMLCLRLEGVRQFRARLGPDAVSSILRFVARTLESAVRVTDFVGRWNEAEFLLIVRGCHEPALLKVRDHIRRMLASDGIEWWGERQSLPVSIGHTIVQPGDTPALLLDRMQQSLDQISSRKSRTAQRGGAPES
jgi:diguanylate cyclase (GGDEF)-like protein/PAS domain S-box-containing protein